MNRRKVATSGSTASIVEKAAPCLHAKMAPRAEEGGDHGLTIKIIGGLPE
jgi:hypothetical protein